MKTVLAAVNSQYIHSNLAVWQLKANCAPAAGEVVVREYNVNQQPKWVYNNIVEERPDVAAFSCYIWNIDYVLRLAEDLKAAMPGLFIVLGGPEASFGYQELLMKNPFIDAVLVGEGEHTFSQLLERLSRKQPLEMDGLCTQTDKRETTYITEPDLNLLADPYTPEMLEATKGKILYFEGSRGCPFSCSYCLSQISHGVRYLDMERIKETLLRLEQAGVALLKFVDRTFNCHTQRAVELWNFAAQLKTLKLHFEIGADLVNQAQLAALGRLPAGRVQLEAGVQSTNLKTLSTVCRTTDLNSLKENSSRILALHTIHYHLDLIAGLPYEDYQSFGRSFDEVYALHPHQLQLGFLKMLKGSRIRAEKELYGYRFRSYPPYEVISTHCLSAAEVVRLTYVEEAVERYYNTGRFRLTLPWLLQKWESPFRFYEALADYLNSTGALSRSVAAGRQYVMLLEFARGFCEEKEVYVLKELLRCDYLLSGLKGSIPQELTNDSCRYTKAFADAFFEEGRFEAYGLAAPKNKKEMMKRYTFARFLINPFSPEACQTTMLLIDYSRKLPVEEQYFSRILAESPLHQREIDLK